MNQVTQHATQHQGGEDILSIYRARAMYSLTIVCIGVILPLSISEFLHGRIMLGLADSCVVLVLCLNAAAVYLKKSLSIPMGLLVVAIILGIAISLRTRGVFGSFWSYPTVLFLFFILPRRVANIYICALLTIVSALVYSYYGLDITIRFVMTMLLTILYSNIFVSVNGKLQHRLLEQTIVDPLTGAFNRRHMESCLGDAVERNSRNKTPASVLLFDIDYFKRINDQFGHAAGDEVLKGVAALIKQRSRKLDMLFRVGGEEFILFLPDTDEDSAVIVAEHLRGAIVESDLLADQPVSVSIGVSELQSGESVESWIKHADQGLYRAKEAGRNRVVRRNEQLVEGLTALQVEPASRAL